VRGIQKPEVQAGGQKRRSDCSCVLGTKSMFVSTRRLQRAAVQACVSLLVVLFTFVSILQHLSALR
jgi:hypothetical protein